MSRREITFFATLDHDLLKIIDRLASREEMLLDMHGGVPAATRTTARRQAIKRLRQNGYIRLTEGRTGTPRFPKRKTFTARIANMKADEDEEIYDLGGDNAIMASENIIGLMEREVRLAFPDNKAKPLRSIFIDMDPLPWVRGDKVTNDYLKSVDASGQVMEITPVYNYYAGAYQNMIANPFIDERILPSIYDSEICRILQERDNDNFVGSPTSEASARAKCGDLLPQTPEDWNDFGELLADSFESPPQSSDIILFPQSEIREILDLHKKKNLYPMYVDITFPTAPTGPFMKALGQAKLSTTLFNEIIRNTNSADFTIVGSTNTLVQVDEESIENRRVDINSTNPYLYERITVKVQDMEEIVLDMVEQARSGDIESAGNIDFMSLRGSERNLNQPRGGCMSLLDRVYLKAITDRIESIKENSDSPHLLDRIFEHKTDAVDSEINPLHANKIIFGSAQDLKNKFGQEVIAYSIEKSSSRLGLVTTHMFPNSEDLNVLKFVDTQVKFDEEYSYEIFAHVLTTMESGWIVGSTEADRFGRREIASSTTKKLALVKVPITGGPLGVPAEGASFPTIRIVDRPPIPPNFTFIPYKGVKNKLLIKLERQTDELTGQNTVPYISILDGDTDLFNNLATQQRIENFDLPQGHVEFKAEGEDTVAVQIFRTTEEPEFGADPEDGTVVDKKQRAYHNFSDNLYRQVTAEEGLAFTDTLLPNTKYYYTFRSVDINGNFSNPTAIMQVEIVETEGVTYPLIKEYIPQRAEPEKQDSRQAAKLLQIRPSYLMSEPLPNENDILVVGDGIDDTTFSKHFKVRITSLDTGRQFDVNCKFDKIVRTEEE